MKQVSIAEAKAHLSALVARAKGGSEVVITRHGKPVARIVPVDPDTSSSEAARSFDFDRLRRHLAKMPESNLSAADLVRRLRDDE